MFLDVFRLFPVSSRGISRQFGTFDLFVFKHARRWQRPLLLQVLSERTSLFSVAPKSRDLNHLRPGPIRPLQDPVTWYGINYTGTQISQWDFQNKGTLTSPARLSFVLKVPLRYLRPSVIYSVPCDRILKGPIQPAFLWANIAGISSPLLGTGYLLNPFE